MLAKKMNDAQRPTSVPARESGTADRTPARSRPLIIPEANDPSQAQTAAPAFHFLKSAYPHDRMLPVHHRHPQANRPLPACGVVTKEPRVFHAAPGNESHRD